MGKESQEVKISNRIQRKVRSETYPTIFGWHTKRDDELSFMSQLSANGLRLVPAHLAGNFSFHSRVEPLNEKTIKASFKGKSLKVESSEEGSLRASKTTIRPSPSLDKKAIYLTFTLSDGDQLMMMHTGELGNWYSSARGKVAFNWEVQPFIERNRSSVARAVFRAGERRGLHNSRPFWGGLCDSSFSTRSTSLHKGNSTNLQRYWNQSCDFIYRRSMPQSS